MCKVEAPLSFLSITAYTKIQYKYQSLINNIIAYDGTSGGLRSGSMHCVEFISRSVITWIPCLLCCLRHHFVGEFSGLTFNSYSGRKSLMTDYKGFLNQNTSCVRGLGNALMKYLEGKTLWRKRISRRNCLEEKKSRNKKKYLKEKGISEKNALMKKIFERKKAIRYIQLHLRVPHSICGPWALTKQVTQYHVTPNKFP